MIDLSMHHYYMQLALEQAWLGRGRCAPNPSVGAVAVHDGQVIASDWHKGAGTPHAEQLVLAKIPPGMKGVTLYVTLEPCNHWGKTPPCVLGIIQYGITQVVYGYADPNPIVAVNNTPQILREKGVEVLHCPSNEINNFYQSYYYWTVTKKPWVTVKLAHSLDAKIAQAGDKPCTLSNSLCSEFTHDQRLHTDIILTTAKTIQQDNPQLNVRLQGKEISKPLAILDRKLVLSKKEKVFQTAKHCHIYHEESIRDNRSPKIEEELLSCSAKENKFSYHKVKSSGNCLDLLSIFKHLGEIGYHDVWIEAGGRLFSMLHQQRLVQRTYLYVTPKFLGENGTPAFHGDKLFDCPSTVSWQIKADNVIACFNWANEDVLE